MIGQSATARLMKCNPASLRALQAQEIVVPSEYGFTYNQLILIRIILLIRSELGYRNFSFAQVFKNYQNVVKYDDVVLYVDSGHYETGHLLVFPARDRAKNEEWLLPSDQEAFTSKVSKDTISKMCAYWNIYGDVDKIVVIPIERVCAYFDQATGGNMEIPASLINSKNVSVDENKVLTSLSS